MASTKQTTCPITDEPAQENLETFPGYHEFECATCGRFQITQSALTTIKKGSYSKEARIGALQQALRIARRQDLPGSNRERRLTGRTMADPKITYVVQRFDNGRWHDTLTTTEIDKAEELLQVLRDKGRVEIFRLRPKKRR